MSFQIDSADSDGRSESQRSDTGSASWLLAALLGVQRGLEVHVLDRVTDGLKPALVRELGATYHAEDAGRVVSAVRPDVVIEATGANEPVLASLTGTAPYGVVCLTGVSPAGRRMTVDAGAINREIVLQNDAVVGSVNANLRHYRQAAEALARAFEPYFSTKATGTGLGLPIAKRNVEASGGTIAVSSERDRGTTVDLLLPLAEG